MLNCIKKIIDIKKPIYTLKAKQSKTIEIECEIREGDIDWYKEKYNVEAIIFRNHFLLGGGRQLDSAVQGIHIKSKLTEKDKLRIERVNVTESLQKGDEHNNFVVSVWVINDACYNFEAWVRIDIVEKPSAIPELEEYLDLQALGAVRKEIGGHPNTAKYLNAGSKEPVVFEIPCDLRTTEHRKEKFDIEAVLFVNIDGKQYQVDTSTLYSIYHDQPICRDESCLLLVILIVFILLVAIGIIAFIIRILYPWYYKKKNDLRKEMLVYKLEKRKNKKERFYRRKT